MLKLVSRIAASRRGVSPLSLSVQVGFGASYNGISSIYGRSMSRTRDSNPHRKKANSDSNWKKKGGQNDHNFPESKAKLVLGEKMMESASDDPFGEEIDFDLDQLDLDNLKEHDEQEEPELSANNKQLIQELTTILDIYRFAVTEFTKAGLSYGHTTTTPWQDASFLLLHELALPFQDPIVKWGPAKLTYEERKHLLQLIEKRIKTRKPTPYLINGCYQQGEYFYIDERALIPRSFIGDIILELTKDKKSQNNNRQSKGSVIDEQHVELGYDDYFGEITDETKFQQQHQSKYLLVPSFTNTTLSWKDLIDVQKIRHVLDLCTGSGCLAILSAKHFPNIQYVHAIDLSNEALEVAEINITEKNLDHMIHLFQGDLFQALNRKKNKNNTSSTSNNKYDLIITNPPYVRKSSMKELPKEYRHEPIMALEGGNDGLDIVKKIFQQSKDYLLNDNSCLICEIGENKSDFMKYIDQLSERYPHLQDHIYWIETENSKDEVFLIQKKYLP
eukprot:gene6922-7468_t